MNESEIAQYWRTLVRAAYVAIQRLDLLSGIFESVLIPPAVAREIAPSIPVLPPWLRIQARSTAC
jgi:predicted nucleic acid-binding protein